MPMYAEEIPTDDDMTERTEKKATGALLEPFDIGHKILADPQRAAGVLPPDTYDLYGDNQ